MTPPSPAATLPEIAEETLRLNCPGCGGGLNLKRRHLGITGQCVHCHAPITALAENGQVRVISGAPVLASVEERPPVPIEETVPAPTANTETNPSLWNFPQRETEGPSPEASGFISAINNDFQFPISTSETGGLILERNEFPLAPATPEREATLFGTTAPFQAPVSPMFKNDDDSAEINPAWGTKVPQEIHASISPFATGSAGGGGFAETLFRDKVVKESSSDDFNIAIPFFEAKVKQEPAPVRQQDSATKVILDGDGRPLAPMTKEEEAEFAKNFFAMERARGKEPKWRKRLVRFLTIIIVLGFAGIVAFFVTPRQKLVEWKTKAVTWLEPGMAVFDYLPEGMRPDWLPRTDFGIDAGLDENGNPRPKMNAFEGLEKLKGDIGNMRKATDDELKNLGNDL